MLRPVPSHPPGPVDPAEAIRHMAAALPSLDEPAAKALALVGLAGSDRAEVAAGLELTAEELADALARGRNALRRALQPLSGSGWCERAERMISDRLDGALVGAGPARLEAHLANCERCVEHERRLAQAQDGLVADFVAVHPGARAPAAIAAPGAQPPALTIVEPHSGPDADDDGTAPTPPLLRPGVVLGGAPVWGLLAALALVLALVAVGLAVASLAGVSL